MLSLETGIVANYFSMKYVGTQTVRWVVPPWLRI
ncbi:MAG: hypothetical protein L7H10_07285 [Vulcanisaeta sp.]|nr:hypothetical protein [Vulcanisaeta sp.]MCG2870537.1 hypothetical protein [Vulcanisaeta sp.]MCG2886368.1 hypothetical protein [Vulcanisaeta sp.]